jgi:hypothetical protein
MKVAEGIEIGVFDMQAKTFDATGRPQNNEPIETNDASRRGTTSIRCERELMRS